ncbi:MAG: hypothetical protein K9K66_04445 [Desulfarculaceae bacterium]|nr:hypothetical protein [Desulfarculaceae bacterium]MCF8073293.1 hypothetical protein [Desulfarculaceae bacterium]MCF8100889.1 hypothetical protein [Desulfarculaceae bacterium]MCF8116655.1 hypothetical protein [Desulfarculaceae bacterium]
MAENKGFILNTMCTFNGRRYYRDDLGQTFWFPADLKVPKHFTPLEDKLGKSYEDMDLRDLDLLATSRELTIKRNEVGQAAKKDLVEALKTDDAWRRRQYGVSQATPAGPTPPPYDQWRKEALAAEISSRGLVASGTDNRMTVEEMVAALKADDIAKAGGAPDPESDGKGELSLS